jgi:hypothetical protein
MNEESSIQISILEPTNSCEIIVNGFSIKDIIADSLRWHKGSMIDDNFIQKASEEIRDVFKAKLLMRSVID